LQHISQLYSTDTMGRLSDAKWGVTIGEDLAFLRAWSPKKLKKLRVGNS